MRKPVLVMVLTLLSVWFVVMFARLMVDYQTPGTPHLKNAYYPYSVELQVRDI